jgi:hypothetical protein
MITRWALHNAHGKSDYFLTKPIHKAKLLEALRKLALID